MANSEFVDLYMALEVTSDSSEVDIKKAYLRLAKSAHPDAGGTTEQMLQLNRAYKTLSNADKRVVYDKLYSLHTNVKTSNLALKEDDYDVEPSGSPAVTGDADFFVDQAFQEALGLNDKKDNWRSKFKRK